LSGTLNTRPTHSLVPAGLVVVVVVAVVVIVLVVAVAAVVLAVDVVTAEEVELSKKNKKALQMDAHTSSSIYRAIYIVTRQVRSQSSANGGSRFRHILDLFRV